MTPPKGESWTENREEDEGITTTFGKNLKTAGGKADEQALPEVGDVEEQVR